MAVRAGPRWGLGDVAVGVAVALLAANLVAGTWLSVTSQGRLPPWGQVFTMLALWVGLLGVPFLAARAKGSGRLSTDFGLRARGRDALGLLAGFAGQGLVQLVALLMRPLLGRQDTGRNAEELIGRADGVDFAVLALLVVVGAPIVEEVFFRGLLLRSLQRRFGNRWAVPGSALLFGLLHVGDSSPAAGFLLLLMLGVFGVVLALLALRTGRLGPGIWAHAGFNALTVAHFALR